MFVKQNKRTVASILASVPKEYRRATLYAIAESDELFKEFSAGRIRVKKLDLMQSMGVGPAARPFVDNAGTHVGTQIDMPENIPLWVRSQYTKFTKKSPVLDAVTQSILGRQATSTSELAEALYLHELGHVIQLKRLPIKQFGEEYLKARKTTLLQNSGTIRKELFGLSVDAVEAYQNSENKFKLPPARILILNQMIKFTRVLNSIYRTSPFEAEADQLAKTIISKYKPRPGKLAMETVLSSSAKRFESGGGVELGAFTIPEWLLAEATSYMAEPVIYHTLAAAQVVQVYKTGSWVYRKLHGSSDKRDKRGQRLPHAGPGEKGPASRALKARLHTYKEESVVDAVKATMLASFSFHGKRAVRRATANAKGLFKQLESVLPGITQKEWEYAVEKKGPALRSLERKLRRSGVTKQELLLNLGANRRAGIIHEETRPFLSKLEQRVHATNQPVSRALPTGKQLSQKIAYGDVEIDPMRYPAGRQPTSTGPEVVHMRDPSPIARAREDIAHMGASSEIKYTVGEVVPNPPNATSHVNCRLVDGDVDMKRLDHEMARMLR